MRITRKQVNSLFELFVKNIGGEIAKEPFDHGKYRLDYNPVYGGYVIERISENSSGVSCPFGYERHSAKELWWMMHFANDALFEAKERGSK